MVQYWICNIHVHCVFIDIHVFFFMYLFFMQCALIMQLRVFMNVSELRFIKCIV